VPNRIDPISVDLTNMFEAALGQGRGLTPALWSALADRAKAVHEDLVARRASGEFFFLDLPEQDTTGLKDLAAKIRGEVQDFVVLGIGGSALGTTALRTALCPPHYNLMSDEQRSGPRLFVMDNVDPDTFAGLLDLIEGREAAFNVISKSGGTAETMSQFLIVYDRLKRSLGDKKLRERLILTTDPTGGNLRRIARDEGLTALEIPPAVGGRYSVLTPVGLFPAAVVGIDVDALLTGAGAMARRCAAPALDDNPGYALGAALFAADTELGRPIHVMMPYADGLKNVAAWYGQLWAESLGKRQDRTGRQVNVGPTPIAALGVTDQHSQLQLYMEGPADKVVMFLFTETSARRMPIPAVFGDIEGLAYLGGRDLGELLRAEGRATRAALTEAGRMNLSVTLPAVGASAIGQVFMLFEVATVFAAGLYGINPLDQPGVELGKKLTYGLMGRVGYEEFAQRASRTEKPRT
jgi:glucose-6-phosphate isomerase